MSEFSALIVIFLFQLSIESFVELSARSRGPAVLSRSGVPNAGHV
jgi:hypothetical protein